MKPFQPNDLNLELILSPPRQSALTESAMQLPNECRTQTTVTIKDQQTIILGGFTEARSGKEQSILIVTPYIIWNDADLRTLLECKVKLAQAARAGK
jgi:type II secretory pathway component GspD/PulD (secretin)